MVSECRALLLEACGIFPAQRPAGEDWQSSMARPLPYFRRTAGLH